MTILDQGHLVPHVKEFWVKIIQSLPKASFWIKVVRFMMFLGQVHSVPPVNRLSGSVAFSRLWLGSFDNAIDDDDENDNILHHRVSTLKPLVLI